MSARTARNALSAAVDGLAASYTLVDINSTSYFGVHCPDAALLLSLGHSTPTDANSVDIPAGGSFDLNFGVTGPIYVKTVSSNARVSVVYA